MVPPIMNLVYFYVKEPLYFDGLLSHRSFWSFVGNRIMTLCDMHCKYWYFSLLSFDFMMLFHAKIYFMRQIYSLVAIRETFPKVIFYFLII